MESITASSRPSSRVAEHDHALDGGQAVPPRVVREVRVGLGGEVEAAQLEAGGLDVEAALARADAEDARAPGSGPRHGGGRPPPPRRCTRPSPAGPGRRRASGPASRSRVFLREVRVERLEGGAAVARAAPRRPVAQRDPGDQVVEARGLGPARTCRPSGRCRARSRAMRASAGSLRPKRRQQDLERAQVALVRELRLEHVEAQLAGLRRYSWPRTNLKRASGSMNRRISQALAMRSTWMPAPVTHVRPRTAPAAAGSAPGAPAARRPKARLDRGQKPLHGVAPGGAEEVDVDDLGQPLAQAAGAAAAPARPRCPLADAARRGTCERARLPRQRHVVGLARRLEERLHGPRRKAPPRSGPRRRRPPRRPRRSRGAPTGSPRAPARCAAGRRRSS